MIAGFTYITKDYSDKENFWEINPHMVYVEPFATLYSQDKSKKKEQSSKDMWCVLWMTDPDEQVNKYYRIQKPERLEVCKVFNPAFDETNFLIQECMDKYDYLCLSADERAYKLQKDQLIEITQFLSQQVISFDNIKDIIDLKAKLPKIYLDFEKAEKMFIKFKAEQRIMGGRKKTLMERKGIQPEEE